MGSSLLIIILIIMTSSITAFVPTNQNIQMINYIHSSIAITPSKDHLRQSRSSSMYRPNTKLFAQKSDDSNTSKKKSTDEDVPLGSAEYYSGFVSRGLTEDPDERVTGDAVLVPTLKFVGGFTVVIGTLLIGFLASNGLL